MYEGVHILPFFTPFDGADAGFDPVDHTKVDPRLGSWDDVAELSTSHEIMVDTIVNHVSWESEQFQDVMKNGEDSPFAPDVPDLVQHLPRRRDRRRTRWHLFALAPVFPSPITHGAIRPDWSGQLSLRNRLTSIPILTRAGDT